MQHVEAGESSSNDYGVEVNRRGGGYGQYALAHEAQCLILPKNVTSEEGALIEPLAVGLHGVTIADMAPGARVLVIGAGPIGLAVTFWARRLGAGRVAVTASSKRRESLAYAMGATAYIDPTDGSVAAVSRALNGLPDVVFECVGKPGLLARSIDYVRPRGTVVVLGLCTHADSLVPFAFVAKEARAAGPLGGSTAAFGSISARWGWDPRVHPRRLLAFALDANSVLPPTPARKPAVPLDEPGFVIDESKAKQGAQEYARCILCHGMGVVAGGIAPDLRASPVLLSPDAFAHVVRDGALSARGMPRFAELTDAQLEALRHFVRQKARSDLEALAHARASGQTN